eukprot:TRINITY_DN6767_c0_g1_i1.p1 TRINITY_DN6767_c0_g1~~TRINITY_DN6767_c0_g1_i1.p1  ORF type:complete len:203 (+),score=45.10 TRINITY_DN6767_c0_g1_i1:55-609(+)
MTLSLNQRYWQNLPVSEIQILQFVSVNKNSSHLPKDIYLSQRGSGNLTHDDLIPANLTNVTRPDFFQGDLTQWYIVGQFNISLSGVDSSVTTPISADGQSDETTNSFVALLQVDETSDSSSESSSNSSSDFDMRTAILVSEGCAVGIIILSVCAIWYRAKKKRQDLQDQLEGLTRNLNQSTSNF